MNSKCATKYAAVNSPINLEKSHKLLIYNGARSRSRTGTVFPPRDFKSLLIAEPRILYRLFASIMRLCASSASFSRLKPVLNPLDPFAPSSGAEMTQI